MDKQDRVITRWSLAQDYLNTHVGIIDSVRDIENLSKDDLRGPMLSAFLLLALSLELAIKANVPNAPRTHELRSLWDLLEDRQRQAARSAWELVTTDDIVTALDQANKSFIQLRYLDEAKDSPFHVHGALRVVAQALIDLARQG